MPTVHEQSKLDEGRDRGSSRGACVGQGMQRPQWPRSAPTLYMLQARGMAKDRRTTMATHKTLRLSSHGTN